MKPFKVLIARHPKAGKHPFNEAARRLTELGEQQLAQFVPKVHGRKLQIHYTETDRTVRMAEALLADGHDVSCISRFTGIYPVPEDNPEIWEMFLSSKKCNAPDEMREHSYYPAFLKHCAEAASKIMALCAGTEDHLFLSHGTLTQGIIAAMYRFSFQEEEAQAIEALDLNECEIVEVTYDGNHLTHTITPL